MGRAGFNRKSALATVTMVLAAEAADIDVLWALKSSIAGLQHHRGSPTASWVCRSLRPRSCSSYISAIG